MTFELAEWIFSPVFCLGVAASNGGPGLAGFFSFLSTTCGGRTCVRAGGNTVPYPVRKKEREPLPGHTASHAVLPTPQQQTTLSSNTLPQETKPRRQQPAYCTQTTDQATEAAATTQEEAADDHEATRHHPSTKETPSPTRIHDQLHSQVGAPNQPIRNRRARTLQRLPTNHHRRGAAAAAGHKCPGTHVESKCDNRISDVVLEC